MFIKNASSRILAANCLFSVLLAKKPLSAPHQNEWYKPPVLSALILQSFSWFPKGYDFLLTQLCWKKKRRENEKLGLLCLFLFRGQTLKADRLHVSLSPRVRPASAKMAADNRLYVYMSLASSQHITSDNMPIST